MGSAFLSPCSETQLRVLYEFAPVGLLFGCFSRGCVSPAQTSMQQRPTVISFYPTCFVRCDRKRFAPLPRTPIDADGHGVIRRDDRKWIARLPTMYPSDTSAAQGQYKEGGNVDQVKVLYCYERMCG